MKRQVLALSMVLGGIFLSGCSEAVWSYPLATSTPTVTQTDSLNLTPGVYTAIVGEEGAEGAAGILELAVTVDTHGITYLSIIQASDTPEIQDMVFPSITSQIIERNTTAVDVVSGGTVTSRRVLTAVEDALTQAGADIAQVRSFGIGTGISQFMPETVRVFGQGRFNSDFVLDVTFGINGIEYIEIVSSSDAPANVPGAIDTLIDRATTAGSGDIDVVSGATATSQTFIAAVNVAVEYAILPYGTTLQAQGNFNFTPGEHVVVTDGVWNPLTLTLVTSENSILDIIVEHDDTAAFVDGPLESAIATVLITQEPIIDTMTGATGTGHAIATALLEAVELASN